MSLLSEEYVSAGWFTDLEYHLWYHMMRGGGDQRNMITSEDMEALAWLAHEAGGWWYWDDEDGAQFTDLGSWQAEYGRARENARVCGHD